MNNLNNICDYIIKSVQNNAVLNGFQYCISFKDIENHFSVSLNKENIQTIYESLLFKDEVADICIDDNSFDIVLYTDFCPNYNNEE